MDSLQQNCALEYTSLLNKYNRPDASQLPLVLIQTNTWETLLQLIGELIYIPLRCVVVPLLSFIHRSLCFSSCFTLPFPPVHLSSFSCKSVYKTPEALQIVMKKSSLIHVLPLCYYKYLLKQWWRRSRVPWIQKGKQKPFHSVSLYTLWQGWVSWAFFWQWHPRFLGHDVPRENILHATQKLVSLEHTVCCNSFSVIYNSVAFLSFWNN